MKRVLVFMMAFMMVFLMPASASALSEDRLEMFAQNNILFYNPGNTICLDEADESYDQARNASIVIGELMKVGYSHDSALAIAGNLTSEAHFNPRRLQGSYGTMEDGWRAWDDSKDKATLPGVGVGIAQWTYWSRVKNLQAYADENSLWVGSLRAQIGFLIKELSSGFSPEKLNALSLERATWDIYKNYERPKSSFDCDSYEDLSETDTPKAWKAYHARLNSAKSWADLATTTLSEGCSTGSIGGGGGDIGDIDNKDLAAVAVSMSWPNEDGTCSDGGKMIDWKKNKKKCYDDVKPEYRTAMLSVLGHEPGKQGKCPEKGSMGYYQDCGHFVATAIIYSGTDKKYPKGGTSKMLDYLKTSKKWQEIENKQNTTNLKPGDVFIVRGTSGGEGWGHVMMFVGDYGGKYGNLASASHCSRTANMGDVTYTIKRDELYTYRIFRFVGGE